ncbi:MAG TPA: chromate resistance protein ChrB domain-containing protein [Polyangia bacterium]|nr:chromate resistance protein ChrB domain-containing protein [Polyangia bacterium]
MQPKASRRAADVPRLAGADVSAPSAWPEAAARWILLIHSIPPRPNYLRVKIGRRLQKLGAIAVKNSVYVLPRSDGTREDLQWVAQEITADGGQASLCESRFIGGLTDDAIEQQFRSARQRDYFQLARLARRVVDGLGKTDKAGMPSSKRRTQAEATLGRIRKRLQEIVAVDYFAAPGRLEVDTLLRTAEDKLRPPRAADPSATPEVPSLRSVRGRTWVTRRGIHVDRIASAWLIRRFIDPEAKLKYVEAKGYVPAPGELRFDMFDAEFTHQGDLCTFEVLLARWDSDDPALRHIAEMVHDIDLRDGKFKHDDTPGFSAMITGICLENRDDDGRLAAGTTMLNAVYRAAQQRSRK